MQPGAVARAGFDGMAEGVAKVEQRTLAAFAFIGGNDFRSAGCIGATVDFDCVDAISAQIATDLATVLSALAAAADPSTTIVGMNYYNPYLASWLDGPAGQELAMAAALAVGSLNGVLATTYETADMAMADVAGAFESNDFSTIVESTQPPPNQRLPLNVNNICEYTFMCEPEPQGPDIHAKDAGYALIAETFLSIVD